MEPTDQAEIVTPTTCGWCGSTNAVITSRRVCRTMFIPSFWERYSDDDCYETVCGYDQYFECYDCGESDCDPYTY